MVSVLTQCKGLSGPVDTTMGNVLSYHIHKQKISLTLLIYCSYFFLCAQPSLVKLSDIHFTNIRGTFNTKSAVALMCSSSVPCEDIQLLNINLTHTMASSLQGGGHLSVKGALHRLEINGSSF